ncbi:MAG TPA: NAD-dependent deacylase [Steroidobacteraceae bacterium]|nr:NAD-dependent deacylase [Steroidobacteraceae bacterium]
MTVLDETVIRALRDATRVVALTGAGISAESGVPTFRDRQSGLWERFDASELATPAAFAADPSLVWGWYEWRRAIVLGAEPNAAHRALAELMDLVPQFTLITQNVDDLHERAGSRNVLHLHGELARPFCELCQRSYTHPEGIPDVPPAGARLEPPRCAGCGGRIRPGVVWFGESLPELIWVAAREVTRQCDVFLCCGTSAVVQPAASLARIAIDSGATTIQNNPNPTDLDAWVTTTLRGNAGTMLPQLVSETWHVP